MRTYSLTILLVMEGHPIARRGSQTSRRTTAAMDIKMGKYDRASQVGEAQEASRSGPARTVSLERRTLVRTNSSEQGYWRAQAHQRQRIAKQTSTTTKQGSTTRLQHLLVEIYRAVPNKSTT